MPWTFSSVALMVNSSQVTRLSGLDAIININLMSRSSNSFHTRRYAPDVAVEYRCQCRTQPTTWDDSRRASIIEPSISLIWVNLSTALLARLKISTT